MLIIFSMGKAAMNYGESQLETLTAGGRNVEIPDNPVNQAINVGLAYGIFVCGGSLIGDIAACARSTVGFIIYTLTAIVAFGMDIDICVQLGKTGISPLSVPWFVIATILQVICGSLGALLAFEMRPYSSLLGTMRNQDGVEMGHCPANPANPAIPARI